MADTRARLTGCRYATIASVSSAACVSRACCPLRTKPFDHLGVLGPGVEPPAARDLAQLEAAVRAIEVIGKLGQDVADLGARPLEDLGERDVADRFVDDEQDGLDGSAEVVALGLSGSHWLTCDSSGAVHRTYNSPSGATCSNDTTPSR